MRKNALFTALLLMLTLTACSSGEKPAESSVPASVAAETEAPAAEEAAPDNMEAAIGSWIVPEEEQESLLVIESKDKAYYLISRNHNEAFYFDEEQNFISRGTTFTKEDYSFDGSVFSVSYNGKCIVEMKKTDGIADIFGEYLLTGGQYLDLYAKDEGFVQSSDLENIRLTIKANDTVVTAPMIINGFELRQDTMIQIMKDGEPLESPYRIEGDTLIITTSEGVERQLIRKD